MKTPAAKAKGKKPEAKTMKVMKIPAAKAKGMKPKTEPLADFLQRGLSAPGAMKGTRSGLTSPVPWLRCFGSNRFVWLKQRPIP